MERFRDREEAGKRLAESLRRYRGSEDLVVLALPRGGVPVAEQVAAALGAPLEVFIVRKLGVPGQPEVAMGAIASGGVRLLNPEIVRSIGVSEEQIARVADEERRELERRERRYRGERPAPALVDKTVILVDDGVATGATMRVAIRALRRFEPSRLVVAVPVAPPDACEILSREADELVCLLRPSPFRAISLWYEAFPQVDDGTVERILRRF